ncbi:hypothetical protein FRC12_019423 [Ceratobasidium sp. 428]|nr:hypothetical protein FRC12_019423 [Ceratobasidium sp. 428]
MATAESRTSPGLPTKVKVCDSFPRFAAKDGPRHHLGIMPADIEFTPYETCVGCTCGLQSETSGFTTEEDEYVVPYPKLIIWDYTLNQILASSLANGANLTASVF